MVHILAPASLTAAASDSTSAAATPNATTAGVGAALTSAAATIWQKPVVMWSAGGAALLAVAGLVGVMTLGEDEVARVMPPPAMQVTEVAKPVVEEQPTAEVESAAPAVIQEESVEEVVVNNTADNGATEETSTDAFLPIEPVKAAEPKASPTAATPTNKNESPHPAETRTLTLEVVSPQHANTTTASPAEPLAEYPPAVEVDKALSGNPAAERPDRLTNIDDQMGVSIDSIELPAMPIGEFVNLISNMSAVPIRLDAKVLGDVGLSTRTKVVVKGGDISLRELLDRVLKEHKLACEEHDGELVVVRAKQ